MTQSLAEVSGFAWHSAEGAPTDGYLVGAVLAALAGEPHPAVVLDVGCGNGAVAAKVTAAGYSVVGLDASDSGIAWGRQAHPHLDLRKGNVYDDLRAVAGPVPALYSLEVVEHLYDPRAYARRLHEVLVPGGLAILSTPYHGYVKNLALSLAGAWDRHLDPLWDHGHIKFWSPATLTRLLNEAGFRDIRIQRVGRVPMIAKSMIAVCRK